MNVLTIILFGLVSLVTHFIEGITGFGSTVLALPFAIMLAGVKIGVPVLAVHTWILALYVIIIDFKNIVWKEFIKIAALVGLGMPLGMWLFTNLPEGILKKILGVFMIGVALRDLCKSFGKDKQQKPLNKYLLDFMLFLGGIIHGAFASGGPFIIIYSTRALPDKSNFRATMCTLWFTLNSFIIFKNVQGGIMTGGAIKLMLWTIPFLIAGMLLGNFAHHNIKDTLFTKIVNIVLLLSGVFMFL